MEENCVGTIQILPDEVISIVLQYNDIYDIIQFSTSCKRFNDLVKENKVLWKKKYRDLIPNMLKTVEKHGNGDWLYELIEYYKLKTIIYDGIFSINEDTQKNDKNKCHKSTDEEYSVESLRKVILFAFANDYSFFYTLHILQTAIKNGGKGTLRDLKDYHITYVKCCLRYLIHLFLAVKWVAGGKFIRNDLTPITVVNFFQQWVDPENLYLEETVQAEIQELANKVFLIIEDMYSSECQRMDVVEVSLKTVITQRHILKAISTLIYEEMKIKVTGNGALKYMNIKNVSKNKIGNIAVVAAIYKTLASICNVKCELIAFPNHLFIEWREGSTPECYTVNLSSGVLQLKRRCPFAQYSEKKKKYSYCPESLLLYMHSAYQRCNTNPMPAAFLLGFLGRGSQNHEPSRHLLACLEDDNDLPVLFDELSMQYMSDNQRQLFLLLATIG